MRRQLLILFLAVIPLPICSAHDAGSEKSSRSFTFRYGATIENLPARSRVQVWIPIATSNDQQQVNLLHARTPQPLQIDKDGKYGNSIGYFETTVEDDNKLEFTLSYHAVRNEARIQGSRIALTDQQKKLFLSANALVPIEGKPLELLGQAKLPSEPFAAGRRIYDIVDNHMKYDKSKPGFGEGNSVWACNSKTGNCTDFHSLFISLARSQSIPAQFEIGFPLPTDKQEGTIGGYHCWAWFYTDKHGWAPVDISEADKHPEMKDYYFGNLTADRVAFSNGRDIELVPKSASGPLNYFVYPHVEVNGKPWPAENIKLNFSFKDKSVRRDDRPNGVK